MTSLELNLLLGKLDQLGALVAKFTSTYKLRRSFQFWNTASHRKEGWIYQSYIMNEKVEQKMYGFKIKVIVQKFLII